MNKISYYFSQACLSIISLIAFNASAADLYIYAGAGLREPVQHIVDNFQQQTGHNVIVEYGGSGQILTRYKIIGQGDLFIAGSEYYVTKLIQDDLVISSTKLARHIPVIAIRKDKIGHIHSVKDFAASDLRLGLGDNKAMALGRSSEKLLAATGHYNALMDKVVVRAATVKQLTMYLLNGNVDAAVIGRASAWKARKELVILQNPDGSPEEIVTMALLKSSQHTDIAKQLMKKLSSLDGVYAFSNAGFLPLAP